MIKENQKKILFTSLILFSFIQTFSHGFYSYYFLTIAKINLSTYTLYKSLWFLTVILLEVPSGYLSDKISQKKIFQISILLQIFSFMCFIFVKKNIMLYGLGEILSGASSAVGTGTIEVILINQLHSSKLYKNIEIITSSMQLLNVVTGIYLLRILGNAIWVVPIFVSLLTLLITVFIDNVSLNKNSTKKDLFILKQTFKTNYFIFWLMLLIFTFMLAQSVFNYWQQYFNVIIKSKNIIYFISLLMFILQLFGNFISGYINKTRTFSILLSLLFIIFIFSFYNNMTIIILILISQIIRAAIIPKIYYYLNKYINPEIRSTTLSIISLFRSFGSFIMMSLFIPLVLYDHVGANNISLILVTSSYLGCIFLVIILIFYLRLKK